MVVHIKTREFFFFFFLYFDSDWFHKNKMEGKRKEIIFFVLIENININKINFSILQLCKHKKRVFGCAVKRINFD